MADGNWWKAVLWNLINSKITGLIGLSLIDIHSGDIKSSDLEFAFPPKSDIVSLAKALQGISPAARLGNADYRSVSRNPYQFTRVVREGASYYGMNLESVGRETAQTIKYQYDVYSKSHPRSSLKNYLYSVESTGNRDIDALMLGEGILQDNLDKLVKGTYTCSVSSKPPPIKRSSPSRIAGRAYQLLSRIRKASHRG